MNKVMTKTDFFELQHRVSAGLAEHLPATATDVVWTGIERPLSHIVVPLGNMVYSSISLPNWVDWNGERF